MKPKYQISIALLIPGIVCFLGALAVFYTLYINIERPLENHEKNNFIIVKMIDEVREQEEVLTPDQQAEKMSAIFALDQSSRELAWGLVAVVKYVAIALLFAGAWQLWMAYYVRKPAIKIEVESSNKALK